MDLGDYDGDQQSFQELLHPLSKLNNCLDQSRLRELGLALEVETEADIKQYVDNLDSDYLQLAQSMWRQIFKGKYSDDGYGALSAYPDLMNGGVFFPDLLKSTDEFCPPKQHTEDLLPTVDPLWPWCTRGRIVICHRQEAALISEAEGLTKKKPQSAKQPKLQNGISDDSSSVQSSGLTEEQLSVAESYQGVANADVTSCKKGDCDYPANYGRRLEEAVNEAVMALNYEFFQCSESCRSVKSDEVSRDIQTALGDVTFNYWCGGIKYDDPPRRQRRGGGHQRFHGGRIHGRIGHHQRHQTAGNMRALCNVAAANIAGGRRQEARMASF